MAAADQNNDLESLARRTLMDLLTAELKVSASIQSSSRRRLAFRGIKRSLQPSSILQNLLAEIASTAPTPLRPPASDG